MRPFILQREREMHHSHQTRGNNFNKTRVNYLKSISFCLGSLWRHHLLHHPRSMSGSWGGVFARGACWPLPAGRKDLQGIRNRLDGNIVHYTSIAMLHNDMVLMCRNAMLFNAKDTAFYRCSREEETFLWFPLVCFGLLWFCLASPCFALLCFAVLCFALLCFVLLFFSLLCYALL